PKEETPARTPWWLTLLRLTLAALLILAAAGPLWNPPLATSQASAPLALLMDDGWGAAATWDTRVRTAEDLIARAETDGRGVAIAHALTAADNAAGSLTVKVLRARVRDNDVGLVRALDPKGLPLGEAPFAFKGNERETEATFDLPVEIRNDIARLEVSPERSSGVVQLLDKRWRRRSIGVITGS